MKKLILLFALFLISAFKSIGCSCDSRIRITFCYTASHNWTANSPTIIQCVKIREGVHYDEYNKKKSFMKVKVLQTLHGQSNSDTIIVFGNNGAACLDYFSQFKNNDTLILNIGMAKDTSSLVFCGRSYLKFSKGIVSGNINTYPEQISMSLDTFLNFIKTAPCLNSSVAEFPNFSKRINISPNPSASGIFNLNINQEVKSMQVSVFNTCGQLVQTNFISSGKDNPAVINLSHAPNGFYFIKAMIENKIMTAKVLKE